MNKKLKTSASTQGRVSNWPAHLHLYFKDKASAPFVWGENDCALFTCSGIERITGIDLAKGAFRGKYADKLQAAKLIKKHGGLARIATRQCLKYGWEAQPVTLARRGDPVLLNLPEGPTLGICDGARSAFAGPTGILWHPTLNCVKSWRVG